MTDRNLSFFTVGAGDRAEGIISIANASRD